MIMTDGDDTERRSRTSAQIDSMLNERRQLLALLMQLPEFDIADPGDADLKLLAEFNQVLVDYIAAGHFGLYERIAEGRERRRKVAELAIQIYPQIEKATDQALAFSERYSAENATGEYSCLQQDLSTLGESLTTRMDLEDQLIERLANR